MKCPICNVDLVPAKHSGLMVESCPSCKGMWFTRLDLEKL
jgi:Zn-finger nucleic acid-binding protein